ncbi:MAG: hypothetical protein KF778_21475 [Rhodocyclaceae bacterium]|nr:hypothetical protein [Rhodocyclaceae bacterium]
MDDSATTNEDAPLQINVLANDGDVEGSPLTTAVVQPGQWRPGATPTAVSHLHAARQPQRQRVYVPRHDGAADSNWQR